VPWRVLAALAVVLIVAAGCAASVTGGGRGARSTAAPSDPDVALSRTGAEHALLTVGDVGDGFVRRPSSDAADRLPCTPHRPPLDQRFTPAAKAQADFALPDGTAAVSEEIVVYADEAAAVAALRAGAQGLSCRTATIGTGKARMTVRLSGPVDLESELGVDPAVDSCTGWTVWSKQVSLVLVVARVGPQLVVVSVTTQPGGNAAALPSSATLMRRALAKVDAAI
jgi:hypothetical protein